ncbi:MAG: hypothetical protein ACLSHC_10845 [Bilophila wadsworthia]
MTVFCGSLSVRQDSRRVRFELAKAEAYGGPAGCYQVRINRVWQVTAKRPSSRRSRPSAWPS